MVGIMSQPSDEGVLKAKAADAPCPKSSRPWILAATILGSSMVFIDGTVVNVALPAVVVLGLGMAVSVAPLTTTVMSSVKQNRAGVASGINNAVSRTAGLLAIALLGIVMLKTFNSHLDERLRQLALTPEVRQKVDEQRTNLAGMEIPATAVIEQRQQLKNAIDESFVAGYRRVMLTSMVLALLSAVSAFLLIDGKTKKKNGV